MKQKTIDAVKPFIKDHCSDALLDDDAVGYVVVHVLSVTATPQI